jgi:hypothetical protein
MQAQMPHCDAAILHAPGQCQYCDAFPEWQRLRQMWRINFTGQLEIECCPCPSTWSRSPADRDLWTGNRRVPYLASAEGDGPARADINKR